MTRWVMRGLGTLVTAVLAEGGWAGWLHGIGNLHPVLARQIYRSAQPSGAQLQDWIAAHRFRSVLNLRGASDADLYRIERATAARLHLRRADFAMRARRSRPPERATTLIALLNGLPEPVLIHPMGAADRTGLIVSHRLV